LAFGTMLFHFSDFSLAIKSFTSVLIIACPCALALAAPFTLGNSLRLFGKKGFYLKNAETVENLSKINTIVFDKTGTLTSSAKATSSYEGMPLTDVELWEIKELTSHSTHPISSEIHKSIEEEKRLISRLVTFEEIQGEGIIGVFNDGTIIKIGKYSFVVSQSEAKINYRINNKASAYVSINNEIAGAFIIKNQYRKGLNDLLKNISDNYELFVLSGDNEKEKEHLAFIFPEKSRLIFNQSPQNKLDFIKNLMQEGKKVMMIGDGLNDAGALKKADVGISLTEDIHSFTPACDAVLNGEKFNQLGSFLNLSKKAMKVIKISFVISLLYNLIGLTFAMQGLLSPVISAILMPLSSISVVIFTTVSIVVSD